MLHQAVTAGLVSWQRMSSGTQHWSQWWLRREQSSSSYFLHRKHLARLRPFEIRPHGLALATLRLWFFATLDFITTRSVRVLSGKIYLIRYLNSIWKLGRMPQILAEKRSKHDLLIYYNPGQNVWDKVPFSRIAAIFARSPLPPPPPPPRCNVGRLVGKPFLTNNIALGERGKVGFGPKNVCFHVKNWSMVEAVHSASLPHIILARIVV